MTTQRTTSEGRTVASPRLAVHIVIAWTLFMWTTRTRLIFTEDNLSAADIVLRIAPVFLFVALALVLLYSVRTGRPGLAPTVTAIAAWTTIYWLVRVTLISFHDHPIGFKIVHVVLAVISIGTAAWAWRQTTR